MEGIFQLQRPNQSHREFGYRVCKQDTDHWSYRENNFFKWKETFRSDRLDQIRSVSVKGSHSQGETIRARAKAGCVNVFFFLSARRVTLLHETGFLHIKGIKTFGCKTCNREGIRKNFKIFKKNNIEALVISIEKTTQVSLWMTEQLL